MLIPLVVLLAEHYCPSKSSDTLSLHILHYRGMANDAILHLV